MGAVNDAGLRLATKVSSNMTFSLDDQTQKASVIRDAVSRSQMKQSGRLEWQYRYHRIVAEHPIIGTVVLIVSELYNERIKYKRILLMSNDIEMQAPPPILMYKRCWRIEV